MSFTRVFGLLVLFSLLLPVARADPKYDKRVKGAQKMPGFLTIHRNKDVIHAEVKPGDLNRPFLLAISMSRGPWAGILWNELLVRWELQGKQLLLVEPAVGYSAKNGTPLSRSVERTFTESILRAVPIVGRGPSGSYLVDLSSIFKSDLAQLGRTFGRLKVPLSRWATAKSFPENSELAVDLAYQRGERAQRMRVHYSLRKLPQTGYKPRLADDRVGYFLTVVRDYGRPHNDTSAFSRYLQRWHLEKADPKLKLCPPKKPMVWHIE